MPFLKLLALSTLPGATFLGQEHGLDVGEHPALGDGHSSEQLVQLLVIADGELWGYRCIRNLTFEIL